MTDKKIIERRTQKVNSQEIRADGKTVVYIMSRDQRLEYNPALLKAQELALDLKLPLVVVFQLYSQLNHRLKAHYDFMLLGLKKLEEQLLSKNIPLLVYADSKKENLSKIEKELQPAVVITDFSPLKEAVQAQNQLSKNLNCQLFRVDAHNIVPVWEVSEKQEYNAYFLRRKIHPLLPDYLHKPKTIKTHPFDFEEGGISSPDWSKVESQVRASEKSGYSFEFKPGYEEAQQTLELFLKEKFIDYDRLRNDPNAEVLSNLSPYLHFGQISSLETALAVKDFVQQQKGELSRKKFKELKKSEDSFLEELIVRKELADNYCFYNADYLTTAGLPDWAQKTLSEHTQDKREYIYSLDELDLAKTHDDAWNASQTQMKQSGKMHGYMRMYWAKKILEWTPDAQTAIDYAVELNDSYNLDGYDPNGYVGILWSIGGLHDRAWSERKVFGKVRYMSYDGLKRKFDLEKYIHTWIGQL